MPSPFAHLTLTFQFFWRLLANDPISRSSPIVFARIAKPTTEIAPIPRLKHLEAVIGPTAAASLKHDARITLVCADAAFKELEKRSADSSVEFP